MTNKTNRKMVIATTHIFMVILIFTISITACTKDNIDIDEIKQFSAGGEIVKLEYQSIFSNRVNLLIPDSFFVMTQEITEIKYPAGDRPTLVYTNGDASINIAFNHTKNEASVGMISEYLIKTKEAYEKKFPSAKWYKSNVEMIHGKKYGILELIIPTTGSEVYNLVWFTNLDDRLFITAFNCTIASMEDWKPIAESIMNSQSLE